MFYQIPLLLPALTYDFEVCITWHLRTVHINEKILEKRFFNDYFYITQVPVQCVDPDGSADVIRILVCSETSCIPIISALLKMPVSELIID